MTKLKMLKLKTLATICVLCSGILLLVYGQLISEILSNWKNKIVRVKSGENSTSATSFALNKRLLIDTDGCKIVDVDPFDTRTKNFYKKLKPYKYKTERTTNLVYLAGDRIVIDKTVRKRVANYYKSRSTDLRCCVNYFKIFSVEKNDDTVRYEEPCEFFSDSIQIQDEYMLIKCYIDKKLIHEKIDVKVMRKSNVEARCRNILENAKESGTECSDKLSVMIFGIDSVSRLSMNRQLPKTHKILMEELNAIQVYGYNKAGEHTFACMMPFLSGMTHYDLEKECEGGQKHPFDKCSFLWDKFGAAGYRTAFVEDVNKFGLFAYLNKGFRRQPADYYGRTFFNAKTAKMTHKGVTRTWRNVSDDEGVFQWAMEFHKEFVNDLHFGYFWATLFSHNSFNMPQYDDPILYDNFKTLKQQQLLNNTLLIVMSDHGLRYGAYRGTDMGTFEAKLPFAFFVFPEWFHAKYPESMRNFRRNANSRLTTAFDMHRTLKDVAYCNILSESNPSVVKGTSLFANISPFRTCKDAGIEDSFCSCLRREFEVKLDTNIGKKVSSMLYTKIRNIAAKRNDICANLQLKNVTTVKAGVNLPSSRINHYQKYVDIMYTVILFTTPGEGLFEGNVYYNATSQTYTVDNNIRRINQYGMTSYCVTDDKQLKSICYCLKQE